MRLFGSLLLGGSLLLPLAAGCKWPSLGDPVPASLASSRQLSQQGIAAMGRGQADEAEKLLANAVKTCSTDPEARQHYADTLWQRGAPKEAIAQLEEACRLSREEPCVRVRLAEMYLATGQVGQARSYADQAIALNPKLARAWAVRGRIAHAAGDPKQALADLQRAAGYAPEDRQVLLDVAAIYRQFNQPQRALETLQTLAESYPSPAEVPQQVHYLTGLSYVAVGRYADGVESLSAAAIRDRPTPEILFRLGEAQWLAGHPGEAAAALQNSLALDQQYRPSRELLMRIEMAQQAGGRSLR